MDTDQATQKKLDTIVELLRHVVALELSKRGVSRDIIGKRLHVAKATVVQMLKGIKED
jgi:hypothetical protein